MTLQNLDAPRHRPEDRRQDPANPVSAMTLVARRPRRPALTQAHVARVPPHLGEPPPRREFMPLTDADRDALARRLLEEKGEGPLWLFAYGSLIWKPAFEYDEVRAATVHGWRRAFCLSMSSWRATPERPGLMLALARGGACAGVAYRMPADDPMGRMRRLIDREMDSHEDVTWLRWVTARLPAAANSGAAGAGAPAAAVRALAFYCAPPPELDEVVAHLPLDEQVRRLARAAGPAGSCAEYLHNTVTHLEELGIRDRYLWRIQALVAAEIDAIAAAEADG